MTIALAAFGTALSAEIRRESGSCELFTFQIIGDGEFIKLPVDSEQ
jgi:hypothetical protein